MWIIHKVFQGFRVRDHPHHFERNYFKDYLTENQIAQYAEYLVGQNNKPDQLIRDHVEDCFACKQEILEVAQLIADGVTEL